MRTPGKAKLIFFQRMKEATYSKFLGVSANADSGGGARDARFRDSQNRPIMQKLFPNVRSQSGPGGNERIIRWTNVTWGDGSDEQEIQYWPHTGSRPTEGRISGLNAVPPLLIRPEDIAKTVLLLVCDENDIVWVRYATDNGLHSSVPRIGDQILRRLHNTPKGKIATDCIDLNPEGLDGLLGTDVDRVLAALRRRKNVLVTGPPGTGKTRLLTAVAKSFEWGPGVEFDSQGTVPFPPSGTSDLLPSPSRTDRRSFKMIFHPGTRYRHLLRDLEPNPNTLGSFRYSEGTLFQANEHALGMDGAALLVIDEINRGPAVEVFGDAVVTIEADKRLDDSGEIGGESFPVLLPNDHGQKIEYYFSSHLYILAAMNSADASVAPMDVAFLRRWEPIEILPDVEVAKSVLNLTADTVLDGSVGKLLKAFVDAWAQVNDRISRLHGKEYQLGHAVVIPEHGRDLSDINLVAAFVRERWSLLEQHVHEIFFGEPTREVAALKGPSDNRHYEYKEGYIGNELTWCVVRPQPTSPEDWTKMLEAVGTGSA